MDTGRFLLAIILMIAVMVVTNILFPPVRRTAQDQPGDASTLVVQQEQIPEVRVPPTVDVGTAGTPDGTAATELEPAPLLAVEDTIFVSSALYRYGFSTAGGALAVAQLLRFESHAIEGAVVDLAAHGGPALLAHRVRIGNRIVGLRDLTFRAEPAEGLMLEPGSGPQTLRLIHEGADGFGVEFSLTFDPDDYLVHVRAQIRGASVIPQLLLDLGPTLPIHEHNPAEDERALAYVVNAAATPINSVRLNKVGPERIENGPLLWFALKNKYFVAAVLQAGQGAMPFSSMIARDEPGDFAANLSGTLLPAPDGQFAYLLYVGPQESQRLGAIGLQHVNPYGWRLFRPILRPLGDGITWLLVRMHEGLNIGYGWVLILFGVLIRIAMWPLNAKAMRSQLKNMEIQPRLKEIQARYKNEPDKLQKEMLRLYKEEGFNPVGGCVPMLIPFPLLITLFFVFQSTIEFRGVEFLWLPDLSRADPLYILPVLLGASMFLLQWISMRSATEVPPQMKFMMYFMPIFMVIIFLNFASGLNLYYASMNFASLPQQLQIMQERKRHAASKAAAAKSTPAKVTAPARQKKG
jgi:YidC/Oxa1 family membrane protein insertase